MTATTTTPFMLAPALICLGLIFSPALMLSAAERVCIAAENENYP